MITRSTPGPGDSSDLLPGDARLDGGDTRLDAVPDAHERSCTELNEPSTNS